jgi:hypothetical protein
MTQLMTKQLVDAEQLRIVLWNEGSRPTLRTIRNWQLQGIIPSIKMGRLVFFDVDDVRAHLERRNKIKART